MSRPFVRTWDYRSLRKASRVFGWPAALLLRLSEQVARLFRLIGIRVFTPIVQLEVKRLAHPIHVRAASCDLYVAHDIFLDREYSPFDDLQLSVILDCGANIGLSSVYLLNQFPRAFVLAVEPDSQNVELCRRNLAPYGERARVVQSAVWSHPARLGLKKSSEPWGHRVEEVGADLPGFDALDIPSLMRIAQTDSIDLLKIDIEWSELVLFAQKTETWLPKVCNIVVELHDASCRRVFFNALDGRCTDVVEKGELTFCRNLQPMRPVSRSATQ